MMDDSKNPLISVIIPIYNAECYIDKCLESICSQSYHNLEILLMLGICTDASLDFCARWQKRDKRIVIVSRKDNSLGDARNFAFHIAKGKYIAYVDVDDYIESDYISRLAEPLENDENTTVSCCGFDVFGGGERIKGWVPAEQGKIPSSFETFLDKIPFGMVWLKMYRKSWLSEHKISMYDGCHEDDAWHLCLAATVENIYFIPRALYHYNIGNENSLMNGTRQKKEYIGALRYALGYLKEQNLYQENRDKFCQFTTDIFIQLLRKEHYEEELVNDIAGFWKEFFPELAVEFQLSRGSGKRREENVVIFGAGADCEGAVQKLGTGRVSYIVDNDERKAGGTIKGVFIVPFRKLLEESKPTVVLISSSRYFFEIARQLRENGIKNYMDYMEY